MSNSKSMTKVLWVIVPLVVIMWITTPFIIFHIADDGTIAGTIGDSFGAINALFSSLAFALLIYTALMQRKELELQREELKLTREEMAKSAKAQAQMAEVQFKQLMHEKELEYRAIRPRFEIGNKDRWIEGKNTGYRLNLILRDNSVIFTDLGVTMDYPQKGYDVGLGVDSRLYLMPNSTVFVQLNRREHALSTERFELRITFSDVEGKVQYEQIIDMDPDIVDIYPPRPIKYFDNQP